MLSSPEVLQIYIPAENCIHFFRCNEECVLKSHNFTNNYNNNYWREFRQDCADGSAENRNKNSAVQAN